MNIYATVEDFRTLVSAMAGVGDDEVQAALDDAARDVENQTRVTYVAPELVALPSTEAEGLRNATVYQAEYRLHLGPAPFLEGKAYTDDDKRLPLFAPKAMTELQRAGLITLTGRMSSRTTPNLQRRFA